MSQGLGLQYLVTKQPHPDKTMCNKGQSNVSWLLVTSSKIQSLNPDDTIKVYLERDVQ